MDRFVKLDDLPYASASNYHYLALARAQKMGLKLFGDLQAANLTHSWKEVREWWWGSVPLHVTVSVFTIVLLEVFRRLRHRMVRHNLYQEYMLSKKRL